MDGARRKEKTGAANENGRGGNDERSATMDPAGMTNTERSTAIDPAETMNNEPGALPRAKLGNPFRVVMVGVSPYF